MRFVFALLILCFVIAISTQSCQKDNTPPRTDTLVVNHLDTLVHLDTLYHSDTIYVKNPSSIIGLWIGTYSVVAGPVTGNQNLYYSYELHNDNTIQMVGTGGLGQTNYGSGTWSLSGTNFSAHIVTTNLNDAGTAETVTGTYDSTNYKLSGIVTQDGVMTSVYKASFSLDKVQ